MQPEDHVFFIEYSLGGEYLAQRLRENGLKVEVHVDHFAPDCSDEDWLREVGRRGWVVLTRDKNIRRRPLELEAFRAAGNRVFVIATKKNLDRSQMGDLILRHLPRIKEILQGTAVPFIAGVTTSGTSLYNVPH